MQGIGFTDIETVRQEHYLMQMHEIQQEAFKKRFQYLNDAGAQWDDIYEQHAAFTAEYGKICSISIGTLYTPRGQSIPNFYIKTFTGRDEKTVLQGFGAALDELKPVQLCGHNLLEFDGPVLMRRYLANGLPIPRILDTMNKKTWDIPFIDTMAMWSGSEWKHKISQKMLAYILGVPSSKDDMDGSDIAELYYNQEHGQTGLDKIGGYNAKDVLCNARIFAKMRGFKDIKDEDVVYLKG